MPKLIPTLTTSIFLVALGCGPRCPPSPVCPVCPPHRVVTIDPTCLSLPPPSPPPEVLEMVNQGTPETPIQVDKLEWWAGVLNSYAHRAWKNCGTPAREH